VSAATARTATETRQELISASGSVVPIARRNGTALIAPKERYSIS